MCGGCGGQRESDWATPALGTARSRTAAARTIHQLCHRAGIPIAVSTASTGFTARWPTGRGAVTTTLTGLWSAIAGHHHIPFLAPPTAGPGAPTNPISTPAGTVTLAIQPEHPPWDGISLPTGSTIGCPDEADLDRALHQLTKGPLRHRTRVTTITGVDWADLMSPPPSPPDQLPALLAWATALQVGGHTHRRRLTVTCGTTRFSVVHGYGLGLAAT